VAFESEKHAFGHAQGTENAPARQQADLPRSQRFGRGFLNAIVVKNKPVQHASILSRGAVVAGRTDHRAFRGLPFSLEHET